MLVVATNAADSPTSLAMFVFVAFVVAVVVQEFWRGAAARRAMTGEPLPRALGRLVGRNRRRYGGYLVHLGMAVLFLGVAASSAFLQQRDVRLAPGQSVKVGDYELTYREPTAALSGDREGTGAPISLGATMVVRKGDETQVVRPARNFYPTRDPEKGVVSRYFEGEANSEVDVRWGLRRDLWTAIRPDISSLEKPIAEGDRRFSNIGSEGLALIVGLAAGELPQQPAAGDLPRDRLAAGQLDLAGRPDGGAGRAGGGLAVARGAPAPGALAVLGAPGPRAHRAAVLASRAWSTRSPSCCSSALVALVVVPPLLRRGEMVAREEERRAELEAAKEAKYREIRDAELDKQMGKLSDGRPPRGRPRAARRGDEDPARAGRARGPGPAQLASLRRPMEAILSGLQIIFAVVVIVLVLLHSGKDAGLSGAFGVGSGSVGSGSLVERNLTRWTIVFSLLFVVNVLVLLKI